MKCVLLSNTYMTCNTYLYIELSVYQMNLSVLWFTKHYNYNKEYNDIFGQIILFCISKCMVYEMNIL